MRQACLLLILAWNSRADLRSRRIPLKENLLFCLAGLLWTVAADRAVAAAVVGMAVGAGLFGLSLLTREAIGSGDALLLLVTGSFLGGCWNALLLLAAWTVAGIWSGLLLVFHKAGKQSRIPFAPFLLLAYMGMLLFQ